MQPTFILSCESTIDLPYSYVQERELPVPFYSYSVDGEAHVDDMGRDPQSLPRFYQYIADGKLPFLIGGEHLVTLPAFRAVQAKYPDVAVIHFDAHTDLREEYLGNRLSHATVIRRIWEIIGDGRVFQFGIRSGERAEWYWSAEGHTKIQKFSFAGLDEAIESLAGRPVYLTIDLDVLDPSCFPGTGTPEAGGVRFTDLLSAALRTIRGCRIVGCDMVELSPPLDPSGASTATALKLLREMLLALEKPYIQE